MAKITEKYGELVFNQKEMQQRLSASTYEKFNNTVTHGDALDESIAEDVARAMKEWALENGATHFTHWFQPQRSGTAEKHDAFINYNGHGTVIEKFSASQLIQSEPDASSFPSGGIRSTFEARGYTAWDPASPAFLREAEHSRSLVIPSIYMSWTGEALDMKTPLLRSIKALDAKAIKLQRLLGNRLAKRIKVFSGMEQEYFLIPKDMAKLRPDLMICDRTVYGAAPVKGQVMEDHYFGSIRPKVLNFMSALDKELYRYGIPSKTKHNEVAPNQFELAPLFQEINLAIDSNLQTMDIMRRVADEHGFLIIHHEKPFAGLNGSGKHMNWSIGDNTGANYLEPSKSPLKNISFLMTLGALLLGVHRHAGLLRAAISDAGNEHRLGSHEAPPAILSIYLGDYLTEILDHIEGTKTFNDKAIAYISHDLQNMPKVVKDISDRNRTSPIAFTGNKFELRALGASANGSDAAQALNLLCAYGYDIIIHRLEKSKGDVKANCLKILKDILKETKACRFEGNNYADAWKKEAKKRGLFMAETTPEALTYYVDKDVVDLFESLGVLSQRELESRLDVKLTAYANAKLIEMKVGLDMLRAAVLPSILKQMKQTGDALQATVAAGSASETLMGEVKMLEALYVSIEAQEKKLADFVTKVESDEDSYKAAYALATKGAELFATLRTLVDEAEIQVADEFWPLPRYDELLRSF